MATLSPSDRIQLVTQPMALPANCIVCGAGPNGVRKFLDFNLSLDDIGAVYFCESCVLNVMNSLGFVLEEVADDLRNRLHSAEVQIKELRDENVNLRNLLDGLSDYKSFNPVSSITGESQIIDSGLETNDADSSDDDSESDESSTVSRSSNVSKARGVDL